MLLDARSVAAWDHKDYRHFPEAERIPRAAWRSPQNVDAAMAHAIGPVETGLPVVVDHGRWLVKCPDCFAAQLVVRTDPRFMCNECANFVVGGLWRPLIWPTDAEAVAERLLERTPAKHLQNMDPGQTAADLHAENELLRWLRDTGGTDGAEAEAASRIWEGHTHDWAVPDAEGMSACNECSLVAPLKAINAGRAPDGLKPLFTKGKR